MRPWRKRQRDGEIEPVWVGRERKEQRPMRLLR